MRLVTGAAVAAALILQGCGGTPGDVLAIEVSGGPLPAKQTLLVTDDGRGSCDRGRLKDIPNPQLIDAQAIAHDAKSLAESGASYPAARPGARRYLLRLPQGDVSWTEGAPGIPAALARAQLLALQLGRELCGRA
jgi:hypothetical protein